MRENETSPSTTDSKCIQKSLSLSSEDDEDTSHPLAAPHQPLLSDLTSMKCASETQQQPQSIRPKEKGTF